MTATPRVHVIHGPNLNLLGTREPEVYGRQTLADLDRLVQEEGKRLGLEVACFQSNSEGELVDLLHRSRGQAAAVILNPGAYTHYSLAIRDAVAGIDVPVIEVHLSNIYARESFRHHSVVAGAAAGQITGLGVDGYLAALWVVARRFAG